MKTIWLPKFLEEAMGPNLLIKKFCQVAQARETGSCGKIVSGQEIKLKERQERERMTGVRIKIKFFAYFREVFGAREKELVMEKGATLAELFRRIVENPEQEKELFSEGKLKPQVVIMVNGTVVPAEALDSRRLEDHSVVAIFPMMGGG